MVLRDAPPHAAERRCPVILEIVPMLEQQEKALVAKLAQLEQQLEALHGVADPLIRRMTNLDHMRIFLRDALTAVRSAAKAVTSAADDAIPF